MTGPASRGGGLLGIAVGRLLFLFGSVVLTALNTEAIIYSATRLANLMIGVVNIATRHAAVIIKPHTGVHAFPGAGVRRGRRAFD